MAKWIISYFPAHGLYCEPFGGAGSVLMQKPRAQGEIYNDLDGERYPKRAQRRMVKGAWNVCGFRQISSRCFLRGCERWQDQKIK